MTVIGWVDCWASPYSQTPFTEERKKALVERIRKRRYNFTHESHQTLPYAAPFYQDGMLCALTKCQWDDVMNEAYKDIPFGPRLTPQDAINRPPKNEILYEKAKFKEEDSSNG